MKIVFYSFVMASMISGMSAFAQNIQKPATTTTPAAQPQLTKEESLQLQIDQANKTIEWADSLIDAGKEAVSDAQSDWKMIDSDRSDL